MSWPADPLPYQVFAPDGQIMYQSLETCGHSPRTERMLLDAGFTIVINGCRLTKKELNQCAQNKKM